MELLPLQDTAGPNLVEDLFPHTLPPRVLFDGPFTETVDGEEVRFDPGEARTRDIHVTDTTFRDGQQARPPYSVEQTARIFQMLSRLGGPEGVIRQCEFFLYTDKDRRAVEACRELGLPYPRITGWIRASRGDFRLVRDMGLEETGMLASCSDYHIFFKQKQTRRQALDQYLGAAEAALEAGVRPRCHLEDVTRADLKGFVIPLVQRLGRLTEGAPEHLRVKIRLCDTMGFGLPFPGAAEPRSVPRLVRRMIHDCGIPGHRLEWHGHNDFHKVHANAVAAWICGVDAVNASLFGFGERTGNPPLEGALVEYIGLKGERRGIDTRVITELADYFRNEVGAQIPPGYPLVGRDFNTTRAGIHAGGLRRDERVYTIFDTRALLGRPPRAAITDKSGTDGVALWVNEFLGLEGDRRLSLTRVARIQRWVMDQYEKEGRLTAISEQELAEQVRRHLPDHYREAMKRKKQSS